MLQSANVEFLRTNLPEVLPAFYLAAQFLVTRTMQNVFDHRDVAHSAVLKMERNIWKLQIDPEGTQEENLERLIKWGRKILRGSTTDLHRHAVVENASSLTERTNIEGESIDSKIADANALNPEKILLNAGLGEAMERAIRALPEKLREAFVLQEIEGIPPQDVAVALGIGKSTLSNRTGRAKQQLAQTLMRAGYDESGRPLRVRTPESQAAACAA